MRTIALAVLLLAAARPAFGASPGDVVINEVAWAGSLASANDEWIELYNNTGADVLLVGWFIREDDGTTYALSGTIPASGYFLIERGEAATSVPADLVEPLMSLANAGDALQLFDNLSNLIDDLPTAFGWFAGNNASGAQDASMERIAPIADGTRPASWRDNDGVTTSGTDSAGNPLLATPKAANSALVGDVTGPVIDGVLSGSTSGLVVRFDEQVNASTAGNPASYTIAGASVGTATADPFGFMVVLGGITGLVAGSTYTLAVSGVRGLAGNAANTAASFIAAPIPMGDVQADDTNGNPTLDPNVYFTVEGWVAATTLSSLDVRIYDLTGGLSVFDGDVNGAVQVGDLVRVSGRVSSEHGRTQVGFGPGTTLVESISQGNELPIAVTDTARYAQHAEAMEGLLVGFTDVTRTGVTLWPATGVSENYDFTDASGGTMTVRIDRDTDIDGTVEPTWPTNLVAVASQFDLNPPYFDFYQVFPRAYADFGAALCTCAPSNVTYHWCIVSTDQCTAAECLAGYDDCDGIAPNGCEADLRSDPASCGQCGRACGAGEVCQGGTCVCPDADGDGHAIPACGGTDCDDTRAEVNPDAAEVCGDGIDQDCSGFDEACPCVTDADGDGSIACACFVSPPPGTCDCNDDDGAVRPGATDVPGDGIDQDCSGADATAGSDGGPGSDGGGSVLDAGTQADGGGGSDREGRGFCGGCSATGVAGAAWLMLIPLAVRRRSGRSSQSARAPR